MCTCCTRKQVNWAHTHTHTAAHTYIHVMWSHLRHIHTEASTLCWSLSRSLKHTHSYRYCPMSHTHTHTLCENKTMRNTQTWPSTTTHTHTHTLSDVRVWTSSPLRQKANAVFPPPRWLWIMMKPPTATHDTTHTRQEEEEGNGAARQRSSSATSDAFPAPRSCRLCFVHDHWTSCWMCCSDLSDLMRPVFQTVQFSANLNQEVLGSLVSSSKCPEKPVQYTHSVALLVAPKLVMYLFIGKATSVANRRIKGIEEDYAEVGFLSLFWSFVLPGLRVT